MGWRMTRTEDARHGGRRNGGANTKPRYLDAMELRIDTQVPRCDGARDQQRRISPPTSGKGRRQEKGAGVQTTATDCTLHWEQGKHSKAMELNEENNVATFN